jgi:beta-1,4-mannosyltransferase
VPAAAPLRLAAFPSVTSNPYQRLLYEQLDTHGIERVPGAFRSGWLVRNRRQVDVIHFHWPYGFWRGSGRARSPVHWAYLSLFAVRLGLARALGYTIAWTIHQVYAHDRAAGVLDRLGASMLARASQVLIAHDEATADHAIEELGSAARNVAVVPHGSYLGVYEGGRPRDAVRSALGLRPEQLAFLHLGDLRAYKNVEALLAAFQGIEATDTALVIAGAAARGAAAAVGRAAAADARIVPQLGFVQEKRVAELFGASDVAIVARTDGGTSGSLILALSMGKPVVAADRPAYRALVGEDAGWLFDPDTSDSLRAALEAAAAAAPEERTRRGHAALATARSLDWRSIGRETANLLRSGGNG